MPVSASRTSSSLNGLMMAMTSFMEIPRLGPFTRLQTGRRWAWPRKVLPPRRLPRESMDSSRVPTRRQQAYRLGKNDGFDRGTARTAARLGAQRSTKFAQKMVSARSPEALRLARNTKGRAYRLWLRTGRNRLPPAAELGCSRVRPLIIGPNRKHPKWTWGRDGEGGVCLTLRTFYPLPRPPPGRATPPP